MSVAIGQPAPSFTLRDQDRSKVALDDLKGRNTLIVFIPFPFTGVCDAEACTLRDHLADLNGIEANVVIITVHALPTNKRWADENGLDYPVLSDFWPHGETARAYGTFNESLGIADRSTFVLDGDGVVRSIITSESLGTAREYDEYTAALAAL